MWAIAAPALAAPMAAYAISAGVTGKFGFCSGVTKFPVTAQVRMVLKVMPLIFCVSFIESH